MAGERLHRLGGVLGLGFRRVLSRSVGGGSNRIMVTVIGIAIAIMLMVTVSGIALGLASQSAVQSDAVDYWIIPEGNTASSIAAPTSGTNLGNTHQLTTRLVADDRIDFATPVLLQILSVRNPASGKQEYVLMAGVVPPASHHPRLLGLPTKPLTTGDPYYANGTYNGTWTGELVLSKAAAQLLDTETGATVSVSGGPRSREFEVVNVSAGGLSTGIGEAPVAIVHLAEMQTVTGATSGDAANQILVSTNDPSVRRRLETVYPKTVVTTRTGISAEEASLSNLPLAMGLASVVVSLAVGVLFMATMMGLEITGDRMSYAVLTALGYSGGSQGLLVVVETVSVAFLGGLVGIGLGTGGIILTNELAMRYLGVEQLALFTPWLLVAGMGVALVIGVLASPYPLLLMRRSDLIEVMRG